MRIDDDLPLMLWTARPDLSCDYLSPAWLEFTGLSPEQALGQGWSRALHPEDLARWLDACVRAFDTRAPFTLEYRLRRRDGEYRWILDRAAPREHGGLFIGFAGVCVDIDEAKRAQQELARALERERRLRLAAEETSRAKDAFLGGLLNELQPPTRAMATWASHLRERLNPASEAGQALEAIERNARLQQRVVASMLELSQPGRAMPPQRPGQPLLAGVRVLVVEDVAPARELLVKVLRVAGAETRAAASSGEALDTLGAWRPDLVLSDLAMGGDEGYALIRAMRALPAERGGCVPAAALTVAGEPQQRGRAVAAGYDAQLAKPVEPVALLATVARLVQPVSS
ncbi:MAG TPA: PAS domain-containing protein [Burkholderiales bacterium]|nr:PAS domain-containing protein [Burkholderiales bacterium]